MYFEEYVENYTRVYAKMIKKYPEKEYQRLLLCLEDAEGEIHRLGLSERVNSNDWEGVYHKVEMESLYNNLIDAGFERVYPWLMETTIEEDGELYEGEEEIVLNNSFFEIFIHWHCLAQIAFNLLNDSTLKTHLAKISKIEITAGADIMPKYTRVIPGLADREKIINAVAADSKTVKLLLDGWGDTYEGKQIDSLLEKLYKPQEITEIKSKAEAKKEKKIPSKLNGQLETLINSVKMFRDNEEFLGSFGNKIEVGKWAGYWYGRLPDSWRCIYKFNADGSIEIGDVVQDSSLK